LPEAHLARAGALTFGLKWKEGEEEFRRAIELNGNSAAAHYLYAFSLLVPEKRFDQALEEFHLALSLDPLSPIMNTNYATALMDAHRYPEALAQFQKTWSAIRISDPPITSWHSCMPRLAISRMR
jgi:tetratricopeptide (TPR) repeat protein